jgi:hypothetical protein
VFGQRSGIPPTCAVGPRDQSPPLRVMSARNLLVGFGANETGRAVHEGGVESRLWADLVTEDVVRLDWNNDGDPDFIVGMAYGYFCWFEWSFLERGYARAERLPGRTRNR